MDQDVTPDREYYLDQDVAPDVEQGLEDQDLERGLEDLDSGRCNAPASGLNPDRSEEADVAGRAVDPGVRVGPT